mmetsp:Transcript_33300/g.48962  ORF Transcript_33300/g.48962 Transcript_33300/m.48962 type:complete len:211 (+) Transcript_33300:314-946(+)
MARNVFQLMELMARRKSTVSGTLSAPNSAQPCLLVCLTSSLLPARRFCTLVRHQAPPSLTSPILLAPRASCTRSNSLPVPVVILSVCLRSAPTSFRFWRMPVCPSDIACWSEWWTPFSLMLRSQTRPELLASTLNISSRTMATSSSPSKQTALTLHWLQRPCSLPSERNSKAWDSNRKNKSPLSPTIVTTRLSSARTALPIKRCHCGFDP